MGGWVADSQTTQKKTKSSWKSPFWPKLHLSCSQISKKSLGWVDGWLQWFGKVFPKKFFFWGPSLRDNRHASTRILTDIKIIYIKIYINIYKNYISSSIIFFERQCRFSFICSKCYFSFFPLSLSHSWIWTIDEQTPLRDWRWNLYHGKTKRTNR